MLNALTKLFGSANDRLIKSMQREVDKINALEKEMEKLSDAELAGKTQWFRERLQGKEKLNDLLPEAFAVVRETAKRVMGMRHFDVQLIGGMVLHKGMIAEMKTGEGKTLMATLPVYLNALEGKGVHVVTVNDYLARRDAQWMGRIYNFLGLDVGCIVHGLDDLQRQAAYAADITYGTNNEFGFDYLRDNMKYSRQQMVQRPFNYAIIDEVDSILIDEARTPLIISGPTEDNSELYQKIDKLIPKLDDSHFEKEEKSKSISFTEDGVAFIEALLVREGLLPEGESLYDLAHVSLVHHANQALKAHKMFTAEVDYIVKDDKVIIIDEFTGRMMEGRRYSEGLHQALEAKEGVHIQNENQTLASITFQNYFRMFPKLAGMTGTAMTEAGEFSDIYKLEVAEIPTNVPVARKDYDDEIYRTARERYEAVIALIKECHERGQPVLVGTVSIEKSEYLSSLLKKQKIPHNVLNARHHEREAFIIAQAGKPGGVTIATNMAGRGTDIMLGGNPEMLLAERVQSSESRVQLTDEQKQKMLEDIKTQVAADKQKVLEAGGLYVIGTERHESRRIDNQLRGRSGRQGDPGASKFFLSLEDDLMRIFGSERIDGLLQKLGLKEGEAIFHPWMNKAIEKAQGKVEARNYEIRKNLLKYDDVMNDQRKNVFEQRIELMETQDVSDTVADMRADTIHSLVASAIPPRSYPEQWDTEKLEKEMHRVFNLHLPVKDWAAEEGIDEEIMLTRISDAVEAKMAEKQERFTPDVTRVVEKRILLQTLDELWKDHLLSLDHLRQGIGLRAYAQKDPLNEYKQEAFNLFEYMLTHLREVVTQRLAHLEVRVGNAEALSAMPEPPKEMRESRVDPAIQQLADMESSPPAKYVARSHVKPEDRDPRDPESWGKVARNEDCPCGSGKKYKQCHGRVG
jgi:preprotein translocase subunit SecA